DDRGRAVGRGARRARDDARLRGGRGRARAARVRRRRVRRGRDGLRPLGLTLGVLLLLGLLAVLDDVAGLEARVLAGEAPLRLAPQQELEIHREVLEFFLLRVLHDRARLLVR